KKLVEMATFDTRRVEQTRHAIRLLDQAVAHDPALLLAYCQLAVGHVQLYFSESITAPPASGWPTRPEIRLCALPLIEASPTSPQRASTITAIAIIKQPWPSSLSP